MLRVLNAALLLMASTVVAQGSPEPSQAAKRLRYCITSATAGIEERLQQLSIETAKLQRSRKSIAPIILEQRRVGGEFVV
jgi:hypothetical protein